MTKSRTKNAALTMITGALRQVVTVVLTFVSRTVFIHILGAEYLGLGGLFSNILSILALSELGIGSAISFYLYKPLAEHDTERLKSLMSFYKICYRVIGFAMIILGVCVMPLLPYIVNFNQGVPVNLYLVYFLYLLNSASTYLFFAYKQAILTANQEQYKIEKIGIFFSFVNCIVDIFILVLLHNYIIYLSSKFILVLLKNFVIAKKIDTEYPILKEKSKTKISFNEMKIFFRDLGNVAVYKLGNTLFNATDNIIISMLLGTIVVGYYSNYYMIILQVSMAMWLISESIGAGIGNVIAKEDKKKQYAVYKELNFAMYFIASICTICLFQLLNSFMKIWVGAVDSNYVLSQTTVCFLCISFYFDITTLVMNSFREASGNFSVGRSLQMTGGIVNIILSIVLGKIFGIEGIFAATIISKGLITITPFVMGISERVFGLKRNVLLVDYYKEAIITFLLAVFIWFVLGNLHMTNLFGFVLETIFTIILSITLLSAFNWKTTGMKYLKKRVRFLIAQRKM